MNQYINPFLINFKYNQFIIITNQSNILIFNSINTTIINQINLQLINNKKRLTNIISH